MKLQHILPLTALLLILPFVLSSGSHGGRRVHHRGSWSGSDRWCRARGHSGLLRLDSEADVQRLARRAAAWRPGCYWVGATFSPPAGDEFGGGAGGLHWRGATRGRRRHLTYAAAAAAFVDNLAARETSGCACVVGGSGHPDVARLRLHLTSCGRRMGFVCEDRQRAAAAAVAAPATTTVSRMPTPKPARRSGKFPVPAPVPAFDESATYDNDGDGDNEDGFDEAVDHAKFPMMPIGPESRLDGAGAAWRSTKPTTATTKTTAAVALETVDALPRGQDEAAETNSTSPVETPHVIVDQKSEFVTLLVLYSIVGVICLVLLSLCLVRCCRAYCGKAKIRYVRQVDADDIPRFMPSSWA